MEQLLWRTCVRSVLFCSAQALEEILLDESDEVYRGVEAYRFLLNIVCGLQSPIKGETEIYGQFKALHSDTPWGELSWEQSLRRFMADLIADAKLVRQKHLIGLGSQSYGSFVRKAVRGQPEVNILGAGLLTKDILPWLKKFSGPVRVHARNQQKAAAALAGFPKVISEVFGPEGSANDSLQGVLVIAAPVSAQAIVAWVGDNKNLTVIDLRGESASDPLPAWLEVRNLQMVFATIKKTKKQVNEKIAQAEKMISQLIQVKSKTTQHRPFGWEDLCS